MRSQAHREVVRIQVSSQDLKVLSGLRRLLVQFINLVELFLVEYGDFCQVDEVSFLSICLGQALFTCIVENQRHLVRIFVVVVVLQLEGLGQWTSGLRDA